MDDLSALRQMSAAVAAHPAHLYQPRDAYRIEWGGGGFGGGGGGGAAALASRPGLNPPSGVTVFYSIRDTAQSVKLEFVAADGSVIKTYENDGQSRRAPAPGQAGTGGGGGGGGGAAQRPGNAAGLNSFTWDMRHADAVTFPGMILWAGNTRGPIAPAGTYSVRLTVGNQPSQTSRFALKNDPRSDATAEDLVAQFEFLIKVRDKTTEANNAVRTIRNVRAQVEDRVNQQARLGRSATALLRALAEVENEVYQTRNQSNQDPLNFPIKLNNKLAALNGVAASGPYRPTDQTIAVFDELSGLLGVQTDRLTKILREDLERFNREVERARLPKIVPSTDLPTPAPRPAMDDDVEGA
jgi:hypothetical protein